MLSRYTLIVCCLNSPSKQRLYNNMMVILVSTTRLYGTIIATELICLCGHTATQHHN